MHLARWLLNAAPADFSPYNAQTITAVVAKVRTLSGPHLFCYRCLNIGIYNDISLILKIIEDGDYQSYSDCLC